jgi:DNA-binding response OmpR family regulator
MAQMSSVSTSIPHPGEVLRAAPFPVRRGAILIVEDRDDVREGLQQLLELHGFLVFDAADADRAWTHLQADPDGIALMLLDLILPGALSGRDLRARQLSDSRLAGIPTVVISACEPDLRGRAQLRPEAWLEKPFRFDALLEVVRKYVRPETDGLTTD